MTWIALACLLALTSSAIGRPTDGDNHGQQQIPSVTEYSIQQHDASTQQNFYNDYEELVQGYDAASLVSQFELDEVPVLTEADTLCRGLQAETVIPLDNGRRFIVCLGDSYGFEQRCPQDLLYQPTSRRCERNPLEDTCASEPCLNGGQCLQTDSSYQCQCAPAFDGLKCELDARVCQTQQPCGQSPDARCQSFRLNAALSYICTFQDGLVYGLNTHQTKPNPCQGVDGTQTLLVSEKGFIMCDGESMYIESCPGGTLWSDIHKACAWPDMQTDAQLDQQQDDPKQILTNTESSPSKDICASQPCLNGGQCLQTDSSYQCQCTPGFDGLKCELDARVCQTQQPCGQSPDARCQSFHLNAALSYICTFQYGLVYGFDAQQVKPNRCQGVDETQTLSVSEKGFIMCDGESMVIYSCPGGTLWSDIHKACAWPDMQNDLQLKKQDHEEPSYSQEPTTISKSDYDI